MTTLHSKPIELDEDDSGGPISMSSSPRQFNLAKATSVVNLRPCGRRGVLVGYVGESMDHEKRARVASLAGKQQLR